MVHGEEYVLHRKDFPWIEPLAVIAPIFGARRSSWPSKFRPTHPSIISCWRRTNRRRRVAQSYANIASVAQSSSSPSCAHAQRTPMCNHFPRVFPCPSAQKHSPRPYRRGPQTCQLACIAERALEAGDKSAEMALKRLSICNLWWSSASSVRVTQTDDPGEAVLHCALAESTTHTSQRDRSAFRNTGAPLSRSLRGPDSSMAKH